MDEGMEVWKDGWVGKWVEGGGRERERERCG